MIASTAECNLQLDDARKVLESVCSGLRRGLDHFQRVYRHDVGRVDLGLNIGPAWPSHHAYDCDDDQCILRRIVCVHEQFRAVSCTSHMQRHWVRLVHARLIARVGGSMPIIFSYFCEFLPPTQRGGQLALLAAFWMIGSMLTAALAWTVLGSRVRIARSSIVSYHVIW